MGRVGDYTPSPPKVSTNANEACPTPLQFQMISNHVQIYYPTAKCTWSTLTNQNISEIQSIIIHSYATERFCSPQIFPSLTSAMTKRFEAFEMWIYHRMLKISWTDKTSNKEVLRRANANRQQMKTIRFAYPSPWDYCQAILTSINSDRIHTIQA